MDQLKISEHQVTLVDQIEEKLLNYFSENNLLAGSLIPNENELSTSLGVARSVLREALSRLKMMGLIESRPRRGMILREPSILGGMKHIMSPLILGEESLFDLLGFRIALEIGICSEIFQNVTPKDILELEYIVKLGTFYENNEYTPISEFSFHSKLYEITGNKTIIEFQNIIHPVMTFVKEKFKDFIKPINIKIKADGELITHQDLLNFIKKGDLPGYQKAIEQHFIVYKQFMKNRK